MPATDPLVRPDAPGPGELGAASASPLQRLERAAQAIEQPRLQAAGPTIPRLAESADALWRSIQVLPPKVLREAGSRMVFPSLRVVGGNDFRWDGKRLWVGVPESRSSGAWDGFAEREATAAEAQAFHEDLNKDLVQVAYLTPPGFASDYGRRTVVEEVHRPQGRDFMSLDQAMTALGLQRWRVWPDGTVQEARGEPYSWLSDDYEVVHAPDEDQARLRAQSFAPHPCNPMNTPKKDAPCPN